VQGAGLRLTGRTDRITSGRSRLFRRCNPSLIGAFPFTMSAWLWLLLAALLVLPVLLRTLADDTPRNEITHDHNDDQEGGRDPGPDVLPIAA
jgi:hypothetical protein